MNGQPNKNYGIRQDSIKKNQFIDLYERGVTYEEIGKTTGVSGTRVGQIAKRLWKDGELRECPRKRGRK